MDPDAAPAFRSIKQVAFTINTNIASMQAQNYLSLNASFQAKTINRVTSGLRLVSSGDDAAGLAIANSLRSDQAVLGQGIRNGNDGLASLQTIDGGVSNIGKLLDRARTLAAQSASGTYSGDRNVLNNEFQSVMGEIDRQAQAIGMNSNGSFARSVSVFVGGGRASGAIDQITNGSVSVDLSKSTVDTQSLGLKGVQAGNTNYDLDTGTTSVTNIVSNANNRAGQATSGFTEFRFFGPGFGDQDGVTVRVDVNNVASTDALEKAVNDAIASAGAASTAAGQAFAASGISGKVVTDSSGRKQLAFSSSHAAFQVKGGDKMANALLGKFKTGAEGSDLGISVQYDAGPGSAGSFSGGEVLKFRVAGGSLGSPYEFTFTATAATATANAARLQAQIAADATLKAAGITLSSADPTSGLVFASARGEDLGVQVSNDTADRFGLGSWVKGGSSEAEYNTVTLTSSSPVNGDNTRFVFQLASGETMSMAVSWTTASIASDATKANAINAAINADSVLKELGLTASVSSGNVTFTAGAGNLFRLAASSATTTGAFGGISGGMYTPGMGVVSGSRVEDSIASGSYQLGSNGVATLMGFYGIPDGAASQALTVQASDANGSVHSLALTLNNNNARSLDEAIHTINTALQQSNDATLKGITAIKSARLGSEAMSLISTSPDFRLSMSENPNAFGFAGPALQSSTKVGDGANQSIGTQAAAQSAVTALSSAVSNLGAAQAVVGKGQNQFSFAVSLASAQLTNLAASESQIRDADLASEAANLTKAQILTQAGVAALAQANSAPQAVLSLLKG